MAQKRLDDYVEVNTRIERFHEKYPNGRILTDLISWENGIVVMKSTIYRDLEDPNDKPSATGYAYEKEGSSFVNKTSALENCETSAVGRALAILGFEIKKSVASKEEVENAKLNQNKPNQGKEQTVTQSTFGTLKTKWLENGTEQQLNTWIKKNFKCEPTEMTERQALSLLEKLEAKESA